MQMKAGGDKVALKSTKGIRQGDCLSTFLFCIFFDTALKELHWHIKEHSTPINFREGRPQDDRRSMCTSSPSSTDSETLTLLAYADDIMIPMASTDPKELVRQVQQMMAKLCTTFSRFKLRLNFGSQKTEVCIHLTTQAAKPIMQFLREQGAKTESVERSAVAVAQPHIPFPGGLVRVVNSYRHLGRWSSLSVNPHQDIAVQRAKTLEAFHQNQRVLTSSRCHIVQNATTYCYLPPKPMSALNATYILLLKRVVLVGHDNDFFHVPEQAFLDFIGEPTLEQLFDMRIAAYLPRVCSSSNVQVRASLEGISRSSIWSVWLPVFLQY
eukprot:6490160-Amphidinium_carterae.4